MNTSNPSQNTDSLFAEKLDEVSDFEFNTEVTRVFNDMVRRSVPGYETIVELIGVIASSLREEIGHPLSCLDLGCSRGAVTQSLLTHLPNEPFQISAMDASPDMVSAAQQEISDTRVSINLGDVRNLEQSDVDLAVMNLVLQFIEPQERLGTLVGIRESLNENGMLILTEKVQSGLDVEAVHLQYKKSRGYSDLEIQQKRDALEAVMIVDTLDAHLSRLREAGFSRVTIWFRLLNWVSFIARP